MLADTRIPRVHVPHRTEGSHHDIKTSRSTRSAESPHNIGGLPVVAQIDIRIGVALAPAVLPSRILTAHHRRDGHICRRNRRHSLVSTHTDGRNEKYSSIVPPQPKGEFHHERHTHLSRPTAAIDSLHMHDFVLLIVGLGMSLFANLMLRFTISMWMLDETNLAAA